jgi:hypothetical protein
MDKYVSALFLPHTDLDSFPTVREKLALLGPRVQQPAGAD